MTTEGRAPLRRDARRNQERLLAAATEAFAEKGLRVALEEIAQRAGVSAGTLYNRFGGREKLIDAVMPSLVLDRVNRALRMARAVDDPWESFVTYVTILCEQQAEDPAFRDAIGRRFPDTPELTAVCEAELGRAMELFERAREAGALRADFTAQDLAMLVFTTSLIVRETADTAPELWRRTLAISLDGLRAGSAQPLPEPAPSIDQIRRIMTPR